MLPNLRKDIIEVIGRNGQLQVKQIADLMGYKKDSIKWVIYSELYYPTYLSKVKRSAGRSGKMLVYFKLNEAGKRLYLQNKVKDVLES